MGMYSSDQITC